MSLFGSLFTGVSSLAAQAQSMATISNNIANVNTTGYKRALNQFSTLVTASGRSSNIPPGGVRSISSSTIDQQGLLQQTSSTTDIAISGSGFFVVRPEIGGSEEVLYTRAGSFNEDARGFLRNSSGFYLYGWRLDADGNLPDSATDVSTLQPIDVGFLGGLTRPTSEVRMSFNLDSRQSPAVGGPHFSRAVRVYDSLGTAQDLTLNFTRQAPATDNTWEIETVHPNGTVLDTTSATFDGSGRLITPAADANGEHKIPIAGIDWGNGSSPQDVNLDVTSFSQFSGDYNVVFVDQNGAELGLRTGVSIDSDGNVIASFSNGQTSKLYKLPIATFTNPNGLENMTGNVFRQTIGSGDYNLREAKKGGAGEVAPSSLEASNVDLADEFSRMIITQRAYSAGTKVISTSDAMLNELLQIR